MRSLVAVGLVAACTALLGFASWSQDPADDPVARAARARMDAANAVLEQAMAMHEAGRLAMDPETRYRWSCRLVEGACGVDPKDTLRASEEHLKRMEESLREAKAGLESGRVSLLDVNMTEFYVAEAAFWVARAKS